MSGGQQPHQKLTCPASVTMSGWMVPRLVSSGGGGGKVALHRSALGQPETSSDNKHSSGGIERTIGAVWAHRGLVLTGHTLLVERELPNGRGGEVSEREMIHWFANLLGHGYKRCA